MLGEINLNNLLFLYFLLLQIPEIAEPFAINSFAQYFLEDFAGRAKLSKNNIISNGEFGCVEG